MGKMIRGWRFEECNVKNSSWRGFFNKDAYQCGNEMPLNKQPLVASVDSFEQDDHFWCP